VATADQVTAKPATAKAGDSAEPNAADATRARLAPLPTAIVVSALATDAIAETVAPDCSAASAVPLEFAKTKAAVQGVFPAELAGARVDSITALTCSPVAWDITLETR
jgi:hypothetical protein